VEGAAGGALGDILKLVSLEFESLKVPGGHSPCGRKLTLAATMFISKLVSLEESAILAHIILVNTSPVYGFVAKRLLFLSHF
jgi:hypothetical protein